MWSQLLHLKKRCCDSIAKDYWQLSLIVPGVVLQKGWAWELFRCSHCDIFVNLVDQKLCQWNLHNTFNFFATMLSWNILQLLLQNFFVSESGVTQNRRPVPPESCYRHCRNCLCRKKSLKGCRYSSVDSSAPFILPPQVWVPSKPSTLFSIYIVRIVYLSFKLECEKLENKQKEAGNGPFFKKEVIKAFK